MKMIKTESFTNTKNILIAPENAITLPAIIGGSAGATIKAGTPLFGDLTARQTAFVKETTASSASNANVVLLHDVVLGSGKTEGNGTIIVSGLVDLLKLDTDVVSMITTEVKKALAGKVEFTKGRK